MARVCGIFIRGVLGALCVVAKCGLVEFGGLVVATINVVVAVIDVVGGLWVCGVGVLICWSGSCWAGVCM